MSVPTYMDYSATTPVDQRVASMMMKYLTMDGDFWQPSFEFSLLRLAGRYRSEKSQKASG